MTDTIQTANEEPVVESSLEDRIADVFMPGDETEEVHEQEAESAAGEQAGNDTESAEPELVEVDFDGSQYKLPPKIKDSLMAQSDYTRKTQELAEQRRMVDHERLVTQQETQFTQSVAPELQRLQVLDAQISQYRQVDWTSLSTEQQQQYMLAVGKLKDDKQELVQTLQQKRGQFDQHMTTLMRQAAEKGTEYLRKHIPTWGTEAQRELVSYGQAEGYSDVELHSLTDPRRIKTLWKAQQWDKLQSQKAASTKRAENAPPIKKPGGTTPQSAKQQSDAQYRAALSKATTQGQRERVMTDRVAAKFGL